MTRVPLPSGRRLLVLAVLSSLGIVATTVVLAATPPGDGANIGAGAVGLATLCVVVAGLATVASARDTGAVRSTGRIEHLVLSSARPLVGVWGVAVVGAVLADSGDVLAPALLGLAAASLVVVWWGVVRWRGGPGRRSR